MERAPTNDQAPRSAALVQSNLTTMAESDSAISVTDKLIVVLFFIGVGILGLISLVDLIAGLLRW